MDVWCVKATSYDEAFQRELLSKAAEWVPSPRKKPSKSGKSTREQRKRSETSESEDTGTGASGGDDEEEDQENGVKGQDTSNADCDSESQPETDEEDDDFVAMGASSLRDRHEEVRGGKQLTRPTRQQIRRDPSVEV